MASIFAKFDGVDGEATQKEHKGWVEIQSTDWGQMRSVMDGAKASQRSRGETQLSELNLSAAMHKGSLKLQQNCASGTVMGKVIIHFCRTGADAAGGVETYLSITMHDVMFTSYNTSIFGEDVPVENFSLNYTKVEMEYKESDTKGKLTTASSFSWDKETSTAA